MEKETETVIRVKQPWLASRWLWLAAGLVLGFLLFVGYRAAAAKNPNVHYHANFALYVNGKQDTFDGPGFYEEVTACDVHNVDDLKSRAHMHGNVNHVVHVHDNGASWSDFFNNLGYTLGDKVLSDGTHVYIDGQDGKHLSFILNGKPVSSVADSVIKSEDVLLITYGDEDNATLQQRFDAIPRDAHHYNVTKDPAACSGGEAFDFKARLKEALGLDNTEHQAR